MGVLWLSQRQCPPVWIYLAAPPVPSDLTQLLHAHSSHSPTHTSNLLHAPSTVTFKGPTPDYQVTWDLPTTPLKTRIFASNLKERMAQRFYNLVLLPRVRDDIAEYKRLNFHLYMALKKALFKPGAWFKGENPGRWLRKVGPGVPASESSKPDLGDGCLWGR